MRKSNFNTPQLGNTFKRGNTHLFGNPFKRGNTVTHLKEATRALHKMGIQALNLVKSNFRAKIKMSF